MRKASGRKEDAEADPRVGEEPRENVDVDADWDEDGGGTPVPWAEGDTPSGIPLPSLKCAKPSRHRALSTVIFSH